ncbi:hypothetical protein [Eleftheria terrae]|uniref:hypothetical protein n=1 Tax=Eleftheria terrae TaxID=1597781 RepID=UPI00263B43C5|nr:hypothetical protein [Eleftheria terrae]WKB54992.1 hypothetical protein N7L95_11705 [Eleftheria terrae]
MASSRRGSSVIGCNARAAVDVEHHLLVVHEVAHHSSDRAQLGKMAVVTLA